jgi:hypothetical protein
MIKLYSLKYIQDKWGRWQVGDHFVYRGKEYIMYFGEPDSLSCVSVKGQLTTFYKIQESEFIWLPLPINHINPERGLWGMVDWDRYSDKFISPDGQYLVMQRRGESLHNLVDHPTKALLRAIWAQQEVS